MSEASISPYSHDRFAQWGASSGSSSATSSNKSSWFSRIIDNANLGDLINKGATRVINGTTQTRTTRVPNTSSLNPNLRTNVTNPSGNKLILIIGGLMGLLLALILIFKKK